MGERRGNNKYYAWSVVIIFLVIFIGIFYSMRISSPDIRYVAEASCGLEIQDNGEINAEGDCPECEKHSDCDELPEFICVDWKCINNECQPVENNDCLDNICHDVEKCRVVRKNCMDISGEERAQILQELNPKCAHPLYPSAECNEIGGSCENMGTSDSETEVNGQCVICKKAKCVCNTLEEEEGGGDGIIERVPRSN